MKRGARLEDLARLANVSIATVSRALNDSPAVNDETKRRIWRIAREQNYPFRPHMPAVLSGATSMLSVVIPTPQSRGDGLGDPFYLELIGGVGEAAREVGCDVSLSHLAPRDYHDLTELMASNRSEGVIFLGQSFLHERFNRLAETDARFVVWGADLPGQRYCSVGSDNIRGGKRATSHLIRLGRTRIAFFGDTGAPEAMQRYSGYVDALTEAGLEVDDALNVPVHFEVESAENAVDSFISAGVSFDGVVCASDLIAIGAVRGLLNRGRRVPEDVSIVGYDDIFPAKYSQPALTTVSQDMHKAGRLLVSKLKSAMPSRDIPSERLPTELILRDSCGA